MSGGRSIIPLSPAGYTEKGDATFFAAPFYPTESDRLPNLFLDYLYSILML